MSVTHVVGVDPGLVHTGVVRLVFTTSTKRIDIAHEAIAGPDAVKVAKWAHAEARECKPHVFIEKYQPRSHFAGDARLVAAVAEMKAALPGSQVLLNTGVKKVVRKPLMELLEVWSFSTTTHHQDLRSAARIAIYGMLKDETLNRLISDIVRDHTEGKSWHVEHR